MSIWCSGCCTLTVPGRPEGCWSPSGSGRSRFARRSSSRIADAEVTSEHVLLALISHGHFPPRWVTRSGITADAVRQRVLDATEGVALSGAPPLEPPPPSQAPWAHALDLAPNPLGHDPRRRGPWGSRGFGVPLGRPPKRGGWAGQYFDAPAGYPA